MSKVQMQVRIDSDIKQAASELFKNLGLDMSTAINVFLHQCVLRGEIPFSIELPQYSEKTLSAIAEAKRISADGTVKGYTDMTELKSELNS